MQRRLHRENWKNFVLQNIGQEEHHSPKKDKKGNYILAVYEHHEITGHKIDFDGIKILDRADSDSKIQVKDILHIDKKKPSLNTQINSQTEFR